MEVTGLRDFTGKLLDRDTFCFIKFITCDISSEHKFIIGIEEISNFSVELLDWWHFNVHISISTVSPQCFEFQLEIFAHFSFKKDFNSLLLL